MKISHLAKSRETDRERRAHSRIKNSSSLVNEWDISHEAHMVSLRNPLNPVLSILFNSLCIVLYCDNLNFYAVYRAFRCLCCNS